MIEKMTFDDVVNDQKEEVVIPARQQGQTAEALKELDDWATPAELEAAAERFRKEFAERSFSGRHEELGKMINCRLCGRRHREGDPLVKDSTAHNNRHLLDVPSRYVAFKKQRINPHHNDRIRRFGRLTKKIFDEDIAPYFHADTPEEQENLVRRAQRRAARILRRFWITPRLARKHMQDVSRRVNRGLLPGGSR
jgi:hypothetical protein